MRRRGGRIATCASLVALLAGCGGSVPDRAASGALVGAAVGGVAAGPVGIAVGGLAGAGTGALLPRGIDQMAGFAGK
jgi:hypothetical protein